MAKIAAIIATSGRRIEPLRLLSALKNQSLPPDAVIIVSADDSLSHSDFLALSDLSLTLIRVDVPNLTKQRNLGAASVIADLLFFVDDDFIPDPGYLQTMEKEFAENPKMAAAGGQTIGVKKPRLFARAMQRLFGLTRLASHSYLQVTGFPALAYGKYGRQKATVLSGSNLVVRYQVWQQTRFDEHLTGYAWMEDDDFTYRAGKLGELWEIPQARGEHRVAVGHRGKTDQSQEAMQRARNHRYLHKKLLGDGLWLAVCRLWGQLGMICNELLVHRSTRTAIGSLRGIFSK